MGQSRLCFLASPSRRGSTAWTAYNAILAGSFLAWYWLRNAGQSQAKLGVIAAPAGAALPARASQLSVWQA